MSLPSVTFSTRRLGSEIGVGAYHDLYAVGADVARVSDRFHAQVDAYRLDRMILFKRSLNGIEHTRTPLRVRRGETRSIAPLAPAHGLSGEHPVNRTFRAAFGRPPGRFREGLNRRRGEARAQDGPAATLADWLCELY